MQKLFEEQIHKSLTIKLIRSNPELIIENLKKRNTQIVTSIPITQPFWAEESIKFFLQLDSFYLNLLQKQENCKSEINKYAALRPITSENIEEGKKLKELEKQLSYKVNQALLIRDQVFDKIPNLTDPKLIINDKELKYVGDIRNFEKEGFKPKNHLEIAQTLDLIDFENGSKVTGSKFYYLKNELVLLDLALQNFALQIAKKHGFKLYTTPDLARKDIATGLGYNPKSNSTQIYNIENSDLCLIGTSEITLGGLYSDTILKEKNLPILMAGISHCFRTEIGSAGQESLGLYRVHQFTKVELFAIVSSENNEDEIMHEKILAIEEEIFQQLEIPYRVLEIGYNDLGSPAYKKYDLEAWMPGRNMYGEITSASNCTDYQSQRLQIRYKNKEGKNQNVFMLNGTAMAIPRVIIAILENYQQSDGSVIVPKKLRSIVGVDKIYKHTNC